jgi:hypothetical protein
MTDYSEIGCAWCGEIGNKEKMFSQNNDFYHGLCVAFVVKSDISFDYGDPKEAKK